MPPPSEDALRNAALAVSRAVGENVFRELVSAIATILQAEYAFIALPVAPGATHMRMLAYYVHGHIVEDFEYDIVGTPCETVIGQEFRVYPSRVQDQFPRDDDFRRVNAQSYAGCPLTDPRGRPIGLMSVILLREMEDPALVESVLKIFAARAEAEIEHRRAELAIREREAQYRAIFDASVDGMVVMNAEGRIVDANPAFAAMFGRDRDALLAMPPQELVPEESLATCSRVLSAAGDGNVFQGECKARRADGGLFDIELRGVPMHYLGRPHKLIIVRDVTERKRAEAAVRASEEQYRAIFNASEDALVLWDSQLRRVDVNPAYERMFGLGHDDVVGRSHDDDVRPLPAEYTERRHELVRRTLAGEACRAELASVRRNGEPFQIEVRTIPFRHRGEPHVLATVRDITERGRAEAERARLEAQLRQAQKMEAIGNLTGGIAHDFNNILTGILGYLRLASERQASLGDSKLGRYLEQAEQASRRARDLIQQMLTFSRRGKGAPRPVEIARLIDESIRLLGSSLPSTVEIRTDLEHALPAVSIEPVQVEQVLLNLCINARDAMNGIGTIRVGVRLAETAGIVCASCRKHAAGRFVELSVGDTGGGIAPEVLERMFEPFYSTKEVGRGSGMGLAMVHGIVHEHGGHICVDTSREGTRFRVFLPPSADAAASGREVPAAADSVPRYAALDGHVLVVDDEQIVGEFMSELLRSRGLTVTVKPSGPEALAWFERHGAEIDAVVTDQTMPRMTGLELARRLTGRRPSLPVLLYTGYAENIDAALLARAGVRTLLRKPVEPEELLARLREAIRPGASPAAKPPRRRAMVAKKKARRRRAVAG